MTTNLLNQLQRYLEKDKFDICEWENRGLNSSSFKICQKMNDEINECCKTLIQSCNENKGQQSFKKILKLGLNSVPKDLLNTEEKEFIGECFYELGSIGGINLSNELNIFLYDSLIGNMRKVENSIKGPTKTVDVLSQNCSNCNALLETFITERRESIPSYSYEIVKCKACSEINMFDHGSGIAKFSYGEYEFVERLKRMSTPKKKQNYI